jgi:hypothetical protein
MGDVPHKSPGNKALVIPNSDTHKKNVQMVLHLPCSLNLTFDDMFHDDVSMDLFIETIAGQTEPGLDAYDGKTDAFF